MRPRATGGGGSSPSPSASPASSSSAGGAGGRPRVLVCTHRTCRAQGALATLEAVRELGGAVPGGGLACERTGCLGGCGAGPNAVLLPQEVPVGGLDDDVPHLARLLGIQYGLEDAAAHGRVLEKKRAGASLCLKGKPAEAVRLFGEALEECEALPGAGGDHWRLKLLSNRSAALIELGEPEMALEDAYAVAAIDPSWAKAHLRIADALALLGDCRGAEASYRRAEELSPRLLADPFHLEQRTKFGRECQLA